MTPDYDKVFAVAKRICDHTAPAFSRGECESVEELRKWEDFVDEVSAMILELFDGQGEPPSARS
jgi:hypothetical protein